MGGAGDGDVRLVAASLVEHPGVHRSADVYGHLGGAEPLEDRRGVASDDQQLAERGLIEDRNGLTGGSLLPICPGEPRGLRPCVLELWLDTRRGEHVGALPAHLRAEERTLLLEEMVDRRAAERPSARQLPVRPRDGVVQAEDLPHPVLEPLVVGVEAGETPDVDCDEVTRRFTIDDPLCERPTRAPRRGDPHGVEAGTDEEVPHLWGLAQDELIVRGEALRAVVELLDPRHAEGWDPMERGVHQDAEVIPIFIEQLEFEGVRQLIRRHPGLRLRLEPADNKTADLLLEVGVPIRIPEDGQIPVHTVDLLGHHVEVFCRVQRDSHAGHRSDRLCPLASTVDDDVGLDLTMVGHDASDAALLDEDVDHPGPLEDRRAAHPGAASQRRGHVDRVGGAIAREPQRT